MGHSNILLVCMAPNNTGWSCLCVYPVCMYALPPPLVSWWIPTSFRNCMAVVVVWKNYPSACPGEPAFIGMSKVVQTNLPVIKETDPSSNSPEREGQSQNMCKLWLYSSFYCMGQYCVIWTNSFVSWYPVFVFQRVCGIYFSGFILTHNNTGSLQM